MGRIRRGWQLTKKSWAVIRADRSLLLFPVLSAAFGIVAFLIIWTPAVAWGLSLSESEQQNLQGNPIVYAVVVLSAYVSVALASYFNVALASCATRALNGENTTVGEGLRAANGRLGPILGWAALATTVGLILRALEQRFQFIGSIASVVLGAAWTIASFFAIPVLAIEGDGPFTTLKRSAQIVRAKWGEGFTGYVAINAIAALVAVGVIAVAGGAAALAISAGIAAVAIGAIALGVLAVIAVAMVSSALGQVFRVAVYRYAVDGEPTGGFAPAELESAFQPKRGMGARRSSI